MSNKNLSSAGGGVEYQVVDELFPIEDLETSVFQRRVAELALDKVNRGSFITVSLNSLATGYFLGQHPLTVISIDNLLQLVASTVDHSLDRSIESFDLMQIGTLSTRSMNYSLLDTGISDLVHT